MAVLLETAWADWPQLRGHPERTAHTTESLTLPLHLRWVVTFSGERIGTAVEPIVAGGLVLVPTHSGHLYALDTESGEPRWRFAAPGPLLHSPAVGARRVVVAAAGAGVYGLDLATGRVRWVSRAGQEKGGFAAAPLIVTNRVFLGDRGGGFHALDLEDGRVIWQVELPAPVRQPAAWDGQRVVVTAEDLIVRAWEGFGSRAGQRVWQCAVQGQSARDYPPVLVTGSDGRPRVIVRTSPRENFAERLHHDRALLTRQAGLEGDSWETVDAWLKSDAAAGTPELWTSEQRAISAHLAAHPEAQTFFVIDAATGALAPPAPVLWTGGCQGVGNPPAVWPDGRLWVMYRSAYGNWHRGVAPLVALGWLDVATGRIDPVLHRHGPQPPWNTFWGTADEAQSFTAAGRLVLLVHQGTLSGFDLRTGELVHLHGARDTFGGLVHPPWARNEWHGPARGGVAVANGSVFWITGSRVLALGPGPRSGPPVERTVNAAGVPAERAPSSSRPDLRAELVTALEEFLKQRWAPLWLEPGLAGPSFHFDHSADVFTAMAWAYPHLRDGAQQTRVREWLAAEWELHPPFSPQGAYDLRTGARREYHSIDPARLHRSAADQVPHPFGHLGSVWLYATRVGETNRVRSAWPHLRALFEDWSRRGWRPDARTDSLYANRYFGALLALTNLAALAHDPQIPERAQPWTERIGRALVDRWKHAARQEALTSFGSVAELDRFIQQGDALFFCLRPHRHRIALLQDLTPETARWIRATVPAAVDPVWRRFEVLHATWWIVGEERQVHCGENFVDPPDLALAAFQALAWLCHAPAEVLASRVDRPFCRADLYHMMKLALVLETREP